MKVLDYAYEPSLIEDSRDKKDNSPKYSSLQFIGVCRFFIE
jgi:hypothetical protein